MAELATIARPYAEALFAAAQASSAASAWLPLIDQLAAVAHDPQVAQVVADPKLEPPQVVGLLGGIAGGRAGAKLPADLANFLALLVENGVVTDAAPFTACERTPSLYETSAT